jgi:uncharacterized membrane protein
MLVWLLVLLLLFTLIYVVYRIVFLQPKEELQNKEEHHYTFKI